MRGSSHFDEILGESSLRLYIKVFLVLLLLDFTFERLFPRFFDSIPLTLGRIAINFGVLIQFLILISLAYIFWKKGESFNLRIISMMIILTIIFAVPMYYFTSSGAGSSPELSILFESASLLTISLAILHRMLTEKSNKPFLQVSLLSFLTLLFLSFLFAYYYHISVLFLSHYLVRLPLYLTLLGIAQILVLVNSFVVFVYSLSVPCKKFKFSARTSLKIALIPTAIVAPLLGAMVAMPKITQYTAMLVVEILGFTFSRFLILIYMASLWFFLVGVFTLREKGSVSGKYFHKQESMALLIIFFGGFLFGFVYYYFMGVIGALLLTEPLATSQP